MLLMTLTGLLNKRLQSTFSRCPASQLLAFQTQQRSRMDFYFNEVFFTPSLLQILHSSLEGPVVTGQGEMI